MKLASQCMLRLLLLVHRDTPEMRRIWVPQQRLAHCNCTPGQALSYIEGRRHHFVKRKHSFRPHFHFLVTTTTLHYEQSGTDWDQRQQAQQLSTSHHHYHLSRFIFFSYWWYLLCNTLLVGGPLPFEASVLRRQDEGP
jgi:hypothetical protein